MFHHVDLLVLDFIQSPRLHERSVMPRATLVCIVDDDESVRESLPDLLKELGFAAEAFTAAEAFLTSDSAARTNCLLLDVAMPGMTGPELQRELTRRGLAIPIVFITANQDSTLRSRCIADGAAQCLFKPFSEAALLEALTVALRDS
jgi:FixJ family two-component response regulator